MNIAIFLNTYAKMGNYDLLELNLSNNICIAVVAAKEFDLFTNKYNEFFKEIIAVENMESVGAENIVKDHIDQIINRYNIKSDKIRLICLSEDNLLLAAKLREYFDILGMKYAQAELFRDKTKMKTALKNTQVKFPEFIDMGQIDLTNLKQSYEYLRNCLGDKIIIKPKAEFGASGVAIISDFDNFVNKINTIADKSLTEFEAETFINGDLYHIDSLHIEGTPIFQACCKYSYPNFDFQSGKPIISIPVPDNSEVFAKAKILVEEVLNAFKYKNGTSHLEFFVNNNRELVFLEVAARTPGAIITPIYEKMFNFNLLNADLCMNLNLLVTPPKYTEKHVISGIFPIKKGIVTKLNAPNTIGELEIEFKVNQSDSLNSCTSLRDIAAKVIVSNDTYEAAYKDFNYLLNHNIIEVN